jgi:NifU-like protein involved in Fe-S cluster formation
MAEKTKLSIKEIQQILDKKEEIIIETEKSSLKASKIGEKLWILELYSKNITSQILTEQSLARKIISFINKNKEIQIKY